MKHYKKLSDLSAKFSKVDRMKIVDDSGEPFSWNAAYSIYEIIESADALSKCVKLILNSNSDKEVEALTHEAGEILRHIKYHIDDARYYSYISQY